MKKRERKEHWQKHEYYPEEGICVRCGIEMQLKFGSDWPHPSLVLCSECSTRVIQSLLRTRDRLRGKLARRKP